MSAPPDPPVTTVGGMGNNAQGPSSVFMGSVTPTTASQEYKSPEVLQQERDREKDERDDRRRKEKAVYVLIVLGFLFGAVLAVVPSVSDANRELGRALVTLILGGAVGFYMGQKEK